MRSGVHSIWAAALGLALGSAACAAPKWSASDLAALHDVVAEARNEGLSDYDAEPILDLVPGDLTDTVANAVALKLARDYFEGSARTRDDRSWHIDRGSPDYDAWLSDVLSRHSVRKSFQALPPQTAQYAALKRTLHACEKPVDCTRLAINLDRLRALPRALGARYVWVNVPAYRLDVVENGRTVASHRIIVGKPGNQTPSFEARITGVTVNPWWNVPCSIVNESVGKLIASNPQEAARRGYVASRNAKGQLVVRQKPGPENALGQIKLEMPNPFDVYIHDTPSRNLFVRSARAFSHGCIRTEAPRSLAVTLLGDAAETTVNTLLATGVSRTLKLPQPVPVYIVYLTAEPAQGEMAQILFYPDIYRRDGL